MRWTGILLGWTVLVWGAAAFGQQAPAPLTMALSDGPAPAAAPEAAPVAEPGSGGRSLFLLTGDAAFTYTAQRGARSQYEGDLSPLFLWQINDRLFLEAGVDFALANDPTGGPVQKSADLSLLNLSYRVNDSLTVGGGLFILPFGAYHNHFDPHWINKLPDDPLAFGDGGIAPNTGLGFFAQGAVPIGDSRLTYAGYVIRGPDLITSDPGAAGSLDFTNFHNFDYVGKNRGLKTVGGRIGFLPVPELDVGYSIQYGQVQPTGFGAPIPINPEHEHHDAAGGAVDPSGFNDVAALLQAVDMNYVREFDFLKGRITAQAAWVWSHVDEATYDPTGALKFGPLTFNNDRNGGYALLAYRPTKADLDWLKNTEFAVRYDRLNIPKVAPGGGRVQRWTFGVDYWINPSLVAKVAYELVETEGAADDHLVLFQFAWGF